MLKILLVRLSSMGDVVHTLPAVTDLMRAHPHTLIDWVVEESFQEILKLHPAIRKVIPIAMRRWRRHPFQALLEGEVRSFYRSLRDEPYDLVLDSQGLIKSAVVASIARGQIAGFNWKSAREALASPFYQHTFSVSRHLHAIERNRLLFSAALDYQYTSSIHYGLDCPTPVLSWLPSAPYVTLLTASSRTDKSWEKDHWIALGRRLAAQGFTCILPWGSLAERTHSQRLVNAIDGSVCPPPMNLKEAATLLRQSRIVIGLDTGLVHFAAALSIPVVAIFCASDRARTGVRAATFAANLGKQNQPPSVDEVWEAVQTGIAQTGTAQKSTSQESILAS